MNYNEIARCDESPLPHLGDRWKGGYETYKIHNDPSSVLQQTRQLIISLLDTSTKLPHCCHPSANDSAIWYLLVAFSISKVKIL
jgi:hypothetical protein